jgi:NCS1 family nucleobase:cation symporter-1
VTRPEPAIATLTEVQDYRRAEPGRTLDDLQPRTLSFWDQIALWGNLGVSLLGPVGAIFVLRQGMSYAAAFTATVAGTLIGTALVALAALAGARTGRPAMVMLRGLFGARLSYLATVLNVVQLLGWATFELFVISSALSQLLPWHVRWAYIVAAGVLTTVMAIWPLGAVRMLRRFALVAVLVSITYLFLRLGMRPVASLTAGSWSGFWLSADVVIAVAVSWVPLAADYSRHSRTERAAFGGALLGYTVTQVACYTLGLLAFATVVPATVDSAAPQHDLFAVFIAAPAGWLAFGVLIARELDESFANVYSTVVSVQNLRPLADRRVMAVVVGAVTTVLAVTLNIDAYQNFLYLLGSTFVPMFAVFMVRYFVTRGHRTWDTSPAAPARWWMLLPWALGFVAYQLVNPGTISWWVGDWDRVRSWLHFTAQPWMSASVVSFAVAFLVTLALTAPGRAGRMPTVDSSTLDSSTLDSSTVEGAR